MPVGAKWTMGFVLRLNNTQFTSAIKQATVGVQHLSAAQKQQLRQFELQRTSLASYATQAGAAFTTVITLKRGFDQLVSKAADFQEQAQGLSTLLGKGAGAGEAMYYQFRRLAPHIQEFAPKEVVSRMKQLAAAGYNTAETMSNMGAIFDTTIASMGEITSEQVTNLGINLDRAFGSATMSMRDALNIAVSASAKFPFTVGQINDAMGYATEAGVQFDQQLDEILSTIGMLIPVTKTASKAGTAYRNAMLSLVKPETVSLMSQWGISIKDNAGEMRRGMDIYADIIDKLNEIDAKDPTGTKKAALSHKIGDTRGGAMFAGMERLPTNTRGADDSQFAGQQFVDIRAALVAQRLGMASAGDAARSFADQMRDTATVLDQQFGASIDRLQVNLGERFLTTWINWTRTLKKATDWIADIVQTTQGDGSMGPAHRDIGGVADYAGLFASSAGIGLTVWGASRALQLVRSLLSSAEQQQTLLQQFGIAPKLGAGADALRSARIRARLGGQAPMGGLEIAQRWLAAEGKALGAGIKQVTTNLWQGFMGLDWLTKIAIFTTAFTYAAAKISATADELYNNVEKIRKREDKRTASLVSQVRLAAAWAFGGAPGSKVDILSKLESAGGAEFYSTMASRLQAGASPEQALDVIKGKRLSEISTKYAGATDDSELGKERARAIENATKQLDDLQQDQGWLEFVSEWRKRAGSNAMGAMAKVTADQVLRNAGARIANPLAAGAEEWRGDTPSPLGGVNSYREQSRAFASGAARSLDPFDRTVAGLNLVWLDIKELWDGTNAIPDIINDQKPQYRPNGLVADISRTNTALAAQGDVGAAAKIDAALARAISADDAKRLGTAFGSAAGEAIDAHLRGQGRGAAVSLVEAH